MKGNVLKKKYFLLAGSHKQTLARAKNRVKRYKYKYNGKELQDELGLNMTAMDFRQYDNALGRFMSIDALAEMAYSITPNHFGFNNPNYWSDPSGLISQSAIQAMWDNSANNASTTWTNGGGGNFDSSSGNGWVNADSGTFNEYTDNLPEVEIYKGKGSSRDSSNNGIVEGHLYWKGKYYQNFRDGELSRGMDQVQGMFDNYGATPVLGEIFDGINAGISLLRGRYGHAGMSVAAMVPFAGWAATGLKQSHHIIPKAVFKEFASDLSGLMKRDGLSNLIDLPVPFHGNHPQYSIYVTGAIERLKANGPLSAGSIEALQSNLRGMIDDALQTGEKLNDYFRKYN